MVCRNRISIFLRPGFRRVNHITIMIPRTGIFHNQASFINSSENPSGQKKRPVPAPRGSSRKAKTGLFHLRICREQEPRFSFCGQQDLNLHGLPLEPKSSASANSAMTADTLKSITIISALQPARAIILFCALAPVAFGRFVHAFLFAMSHALHLAPAPRKKPAAASAAGVIS